MGAFAVVPGHRDPRRWAVLAVFCTVAFNQCLSWLTFSSVKPQYIEEYYGSQVAGADPTALLALLLNWGPIVFIPCIPVCTWLLSARHGVKRTIQVACALSFAACFIRAIPCYFSAEQRRAPSTVYYLHVAQILNAAAGPFVMCSPSRLSSIWFPPEERTMATSLATAANDLGCTVGSLLGPYLVQNPGRLRSLLNLTLGLSVPPFAVAFFALSAAPRSGGSDAQGYANIVVPNNGSPRGRHQGVNKRNLLVATRNEERAVANGTGADADNHVCPDNAVVAKLKSERFWVHVMRAFAQRNFVTLAVLAGSIAGVQTAWNSTFQSTLSSVASLSSTDIGWIAFANNSGYNAGEFCAAMFGERMFSRQLKRAIVYGLSLALAAATWFMLCLPSPFYSGTGDRASIYSSSVVVGLGMGFCYPLYMELAAEITYPAPEGVSSSGIGFMYNVSALIVLSVESTIDPKSINFIMAVTVAASLSLLTCVNESYCRSEKEDEYSAPGRGKGMDAQGSNVRVCITSSDSDSDTVDTPLLLTGKALRSE